jgi:hypothetical protein
MGHTEEVGDTVLICDGGTPTPAGQAVPQYNIQVSFNTNVTSRLLNGLWSEALLLIDEPVEAIQLVCGDVNAPQTSPGVCSIIANGSSVYDGSPGYPNVFQGRLAGANSIIWTGVPLDPPGSGLPLFIRMTNVRVDAAALSRVIPNPVNMTIDASGLPLDHTQQSVADVQTYDTFSVPTPPALQECISENAALATDPSSNGTAQLHLNYTEGFSTALKTRKISTVPNLIQPPLLNQDDPGNSGNFPTETAFFNSYFPTITDQGNLALAGLADSGTRLVAKFFHVPAGVQLFANTTLHLSSGKSSVARMVQTDDAGNGPYSPVIGNTFGLAPFIGKGPTRTVVYEVLGEIPFIIDQANIPVYVAYNANAPSSPGLSAVTAAAGPAPLSASNTASETESIPRFAPPFLTVPAFQITSCDGGCAADVSGQIATFKGPIVYSQKPKLFLQSVWMQNVSANPIQGPVSLAIYNSSSAAVLANPTGFTSCGSQQAPYLNLDLPSGSAFAPGQQVIVKLAFAAKSAAAINYGMRVLAGPGNR